MLSLTLSTLLAPFASSTPSCSDIIHPIKMHYEILHRVIHPCCTMPCGGGAVMMMVMVCVWPSRHPSPCPSWPHPKPTTTSFFGKIKKKKNLFNPITIYLNLTKNNNKKLKIKPPHHSSVYIFAHVESGWFVIYFSKLPAALSCGSPINFLPSATLSLMCWPLTPTACAFWISPINSQTVELLI